MKVESLNGSDGTARAAPTIELTALSTTKRGRRKWRRRNLSAIIFGYSPIAQLVERRTVNP
jgi:hypothetical protein